jgi:hypothetical protein
MDFSIFENIELKTIFALNELGALKPSFELAWPEIVCLIKYPFFRPKRLTSIPHVRDEE